MFYTSDSLDGAMGTGLWQPGDSHTRGIYIENTGTLNGDFNSLYAAPEAPVGSQDYLNALEFANQSNIIVSMFEKTEGEIDAKAWSLVLKNTDAFIKSQLFDFTASQQAQAEGKTVEEIKLENLNFLALLKETLLNKIFVTQNAIGQNVYFKVNQVYTGSLKDLINPGVTVPADLQYTIKPGETMYLGYTVQMQDLTPEQNNKLQGKEVKFAFTHEFVQE